VIRQRRYARLKLSKHIPATTTNLRGNLRLSVGELNMGGSELRTATWLQDPS